MQVSNTCCRRSGNGGPQTCLPVACGVAQRGAKHGPSSPTQTQDPREGPGLARRTTRRILRCSLIRLAREEAETSRRGTSRGAHDVSHDDSGCQAGTSSRSVLLSSLVQRGQAQPRSTEASGKGCHFGATRPRPGGPRDGGHHGAQHGVIARAFGRRRLLLSGYVYSLSPFKLARHCWIPSRSTFRKRTRASINRTSHPQGKGFEE